VIPPCLREECSPDLGVKTNVFSIFRLLTNFEMDSKLIVSIIFVGQPQLKIILQKSSLEDIASRMSHYGELRLLTREESLDYLKHRMRIAGSTIFPFDDRACEALFEFSRGNIRALGQLARKAMELASSKGIETIGQGHVVEARSNLAI
jgi:general secretion pathway protein A